MNTCPNGHRSETADFCSVCGAELIAPVLSTRSASPVQPCPSCGTPRESATQVFCEACGCDLRTAAPIAPVAVCWEIVVEIDAGLYGERDPQAPEGVPARTYTLFDADNLVGRYDEAVRTQIPVHDDHGVSRRQALLRVHPDGGLVIRDLGSSNGTFVNRKPLPADADANLADGDVVGIGAWTRLTIRARSENAR